MGKRRKDTRSAEDRIADRDRALSESQDERSRQHGHQASPDGRLLTELGQTVALDHYAKANDAPLTADKVRADWPGSFQSEPAGTSPQREPQPNTPRPRRSELAAGHPVSASVIGSPDSGSVLNLHTVAPSDQVRVQWDANESQAVGIGSTLRQHIAGSANVSRLDQARASNETLRPQLGDRAPMGTDGMDRHQIPTGTAGNYPGQRTGEAPLSVPARPGMADPTANTGMRHALDRDYARPLGNAPDRMPPGHQFTSRVPGSD